MGYYSQNQTSCNRGNTVCTSYIYHIYVGTSNFVDNGLTTTCQVSTDNIISLDTYTYVHVQTSNEQAYNIYIFKHFLSDLVIFD